VRGAGVHPLRARRHHVDVWVRHLSETAQPSSTVGLTADELDRLLTPPNGMGRAPRR